MTVAQKAKELVERMYNPGFDADNNVLGTLTRKQAKQCALIAIDFAIKAIEDCSVVAGYPLEEYKQIKDELLKL